MKKFDKKESYLHDSAKKVFVEGICGRSYKEGLFYPSDITLHNKGALVESISGVGSCDVSWNITLEKEITLNDNITGKPYLAFIPDIYIYDESTCDILLIEIVHTHSINKEKLDRINNWIKAEKLISKYGDIRLFEVPGIDVLAIDKYSHDKDTHSWKFPLKFLDKYEI